MGIFKLRVLADGTKVDARGASQAMWPRHDRLHLALADVSPAFTSTGSVCVFVPFSHVQLFVLIIVDRDRLEYAQ